MKVDNILERLGRDVTAENSQTTQISREEKMLRGAAWSTLSDFISRLLGAIYIIPWYAWMGKDLAPQANTLYSMGYVVYGTILTWSTMGLNVAVAKQIAKYNAIEQEEKGLRLTRSFLGLMGLVGLVAAGMMYFGAPLFSRVSGLEQELIPVFRSLTLAVLAYPVMSVIRGVFQGYNNIKPNALSQMAEQLVRVIWMLLTTFYIMKLGSKNYVSAVTQSTFAAFIGMLASVAVLVYFLWKEGILIKLLTVQQGQSQDGTSLALLLETVKEAIPFIITGSAIQLYQLIDQATFINTMLWLTKESRENLSILYSYLSANPSKITMIIISIAGSIGGVGIALLTESFMQKDRKGTARLILNSMQMLLVFILPALTGAILLAQPLYSLFYRTATTIEIGLFVSLLLQTFLVCFYVLLSPMLHAILESKAAIRYFVYGVMAKLLSQLPAIYLFRAYGPVWSTMLGLLLPLVLMYRQLQRKTRFNQEVVVRNALLITINTLVMAVAVILVDLLLSLFLQPTGRLSAIVHLLVGTLTGGLVYGYLALRTRSLDKLLGQRAATLRQKLRIG